MRQIAKVPLVLVAAFFLQHTAAAQGIIRETPPPSRAEWAHKAKIYGRDFSTSDVTKIVVIGSGTPAADLRHGGISVAVIVNGQPYIVDCGPGFWRNSQANTPQWGGKIKELVPPKLTRLFLTHLHFDHTEGLPAFMISPWAHGRTENPKVYGPPGTEKLVHHVTEAYLKDVHLQMFGQPLPGAGWRMEAKDVLPGEIYKDQNIKITAHQNHHGTWDYSYALRVITFAPDGSVDRTIVFSGDTSSFDGFEKAYADADFLFHEAFSLDPKRDQAPVSVAYMNEFHTSTQTLADILKKVKPKVTVLYHYMQFTPAEHTDDQRGVKEIKKFGYDGVVLQAQDGDIY